MLPSGVVELATATLCGAAVGLERQWSGHADGTSARFAGLRTFTLPGRSAAAARPPASAAPGNPLQLLPALQMAALFQGVLVVVHLLREWWGAPGVLFSAGVLGLTDVDALTVSMTRDVAVTLSAQTAALGIAVGVLANIAMKTAVAVTLGARGFAVLTGSILSLQLAVLATSLASRFPWP